ncbi:UDP-N-acetylmuramoyl-L-alanine--D-glutamate ligase [uncultured Oscillibacter sp.]|uniref:UDP-N-acetylmuramoyl-L-alanine--D-glutamate ligase n=1 Tax=uncultured Oscillibacter sp. TaxID=876091 RepID=UPI0025EB78C3|nr:UDP-N-acetylmuramoyl-L-alanine--D-glutamate ligase [uncultured Oscillibacter sp.]
MKFEEYLSSLQNKTVAVIGIGISNRPLVELLLSRGVAVTACDKKDRAALGVLAEELEKKGCRLRLGPDYLKNLTEDVIFRTPGMRPDLPELTAAVGRGSMLTSEMEVFFEVCPCPIIAVTGSDGKTTTTTIIAELLRAAGRTVHLGGNIGHPLLAETGGIRKGDMAVLELSSFQLMTMNQSPHIAVITNLAPNHLDVHKDYAEYIAAKENIFTHQAAEDIAVFNADNEVTRSFMGRENGSLRTFSRRGSVERGAYLAPDTDGTGPAIWMSNETGRRQVLPLAGIKLPGVHNVENYMAAVAAVDGLVPDDVIRDFAGDFGGVEHRIELVRELDGVRYYNDSIASSPSRTIAGLNSFPEKIILIAGGKDKGISYESLGPVVNAHVKLLILCGATAGVIRASVERAENYDDLEIVDVEDYHQAVSLARSRAAEGDVVMLSPASTSFDRFANFMERGRVFKEIVNQLPEKR